MSSDAEPLRTAGVFDTIKPWPGWCRGRSTRQRHDKIFPDFTGSKKLLSAGNGISTWSISTKPSSGSRCFVRGHRPRVFERAAGFEIGGDAGRTEHMAAEIDLDRLRPFAGGSSDRYRRGASGFPSTGPSCRPPSGRGGLAVVADAGRGEISSRTVRASDAPAFRDACRRDSSPRCA
jgi:hypothetical protein